jgi:hypothetical protein
MKFSEEFPSKYLKAADIQALGPPVRVTMTNIDKETTARGDKMLVLFFAELEKGMILKKVNAKVIEQLYGDDMNGWEGQPLDLVVRQQEFAGKIYDVIRVQPPKASKAKVPDVA